MNTGGCSRFKATNFNAKFSQTVRQKLCRKRCIRAALVGDLTNVDNAAKVCTRRNDSSLDRIFSTKPSSHTRNVTVLCENFSNFRLLYIKIFRVLASLFHSVVILYPVSLNTQTVNGRAFSSVKHTALNKTFISRLAHLTAERIDLTHKMSLCRAAN